ncbi:MAG: hypothetical protein FWG89_03350 [Treponema sp.]|nr:hypothetical protein [Treponema sp.]
MKKITITLLITVCICGAAFAQEQKLFSVTVEGAADPLFIRFFFGDYTNKEPALMHSGSMQPPYLYQGDSFGMVQSFQTSGFVDGIRGRTGFAYNGEKLGGGLQMRIKNDEGYGQTLWDWSLWAKLFDERVRFTVGNTGQGGNIPRYANFDGFLRGQIGELGVMYPIWRMTARPTHLVNNLDITLNFPYGYTELDYSLGFAEFTSTMTNDLFVPAGDNGRVPLGILTDIRIDPVTVSLSLGGLFADIRKPFKSPFESTLDGGTLSDYDKEPVINQSMNAGIRVESSNIAGLINLAAVYKLAYSWLHKTESTNAAPTFIDAKSFDHAYGVYANTDLPMVEGLGITVGYSGLIKSLENPLHSRWNIPPFTSDYDDYRLTEYSKVHFPVFHGIDLRAQYTGFDRLVISFNNNISFAKVKGPDRGKNEYTDSWAYYFQVNAISHYRQENYLGLYNALGVNYHLDEKTTLMFQLANQMGLFTLTYEEGKVRTLIDHLGFFAGIRYSFVENDYMRAVFRTGLALYLHSFQHQEPGVGTHRAGWYDFGIPLALTVSF